MIFSRFPQEIAKRYTTVFPDKPGSHVVISENYYSRTKDLFNPLWGRRFNRVRTVIYSWPHKFIHSSDGKHELYHLVDDPKESHNLVEHQAQITERLTEVLEQFKVQRRDESIKETNIQPLTEEDRERLKSLGYIQD